MREADLAEEISIFNTSENIASLQMALGIADSQFQPWKVFINHIDTYHNQKLAEHLEGLNYYNPEEEGKSVNVNVDNTNEREEENLDNANFEKKYKIIGTIKDKKYNWPETLKVINNSEDKDEFLSELLKCGIIIYDITQDPSQIVEASWVLQAMIEKIENSKELAKQTRYVILMSTVMTWARTKPLDPKDPELPLTEADYRKRKAHPNYKQHIQLEREVIAVKKRKNTTKALKTLVVCCGITYGDEESHLHFLFKMAWLNQDLPLFGKGNNKIPLLHVRDLITIISKILLNWPKTLRYILAVEQEVISQATIVKRISKTLGTGRIRRMAKEESFLLAEVTQQIYDIMTMNLKVDATYIVDLLERWHFDTPFRDSINEIVNEYKEARDLHPVKIVVLGPPASGKTRVARYLSDYYRIPYIHVRTLITDTLQRLSLKIEEKIKLSEIQDERRRGKSEEDGDNYDEDDDDDDADDDEEKEEEKREEGDEENGSLESLKAQLEDIRKNLSENNGRLDDVTLNKLFRRRLLCRDCQNQGYVLDGHPKTLEQAKALFETNAANNNEKTEDADENVRGESSTESSLLSPEQVIVLEATDEFLTERVMCRPEKEIQHTHYSEKEMIRRLREYRERNTEEGTPLQLFDEIEVHPIFISIEEDACPDMIPTISRCIQIIGKPRNYGPSAEEAATLERLAKEKARAAELTAKLSEKRRSFDMKKNRELKMIEWTNLMERLKQEEEAQLCLLGEPLRHYLMKYIFPTLTQGLMQVSNLRPDDPIDFLAEYLFKENPEGKMFEPDYTETMSVLMKEIESFQKDLLPKEDLDDGIMDYLRREDEEDQAEMHMHEVDPSDLYRRAEKSSKSRSSRTNSIARLEESCSFMSFENESYDQ